MSFVRNTALATAAVAALTLGAFVATPTFAQVKTVMVGGAAMCPNKNIIENAVNSKDHTTLVALKAAAIEAHVWAVRVKGAICSPVCRGTDASRQWPPTDRNVSPATNA